MNGLDSIEDLLFLLPVDGSQRVEERLEYYVRNSSCPIRDAYIALGVSLGLAHIPEKKIKRRLADFVCDNPELTDEERHQVHIRAVRDFSGVNPAQFYQTEIRPRICSYRMPTLKLTPRKVARPGESSGRRLAVREEVEYPDPGIAEAEEAPDEDRLVVASHG